jgi:hypothetical protein
VAEGPSGFSDWPRPFVFRARHLDGCTVRPGEQFHFDVNIFDLRGNAIPYFVLTFGQLANDGLGPRRGRAEMSMVSLLSSSHTPAQVIFDGSTFLLADVPQPVVLSLDSKIPYTGSIRVEFLSPTELKTGQQLATRPEFPILFGRIRDRLSTLRALYGLGPLAIDFKQMGERAGAVKMTQFQLKTLVVERRSGRTGQTHPIGGFLGSAEYSGDMTEFVPYLEASRWTGVGRQTVWGKGEIGLVLPNKQNTL